ncbi:rpsP small subunit ribosomal protein S16 [Caldithrix abyssi DSM 13497]|uniref:30S ribosomal protein S16 n=1 Tax=Caldithrix abyssi DSM 13497 TaxID=880073 RepID=A0A1J1C5I3_CALAY|nr:rpsP small subunit ribosomal protein S16 [Caldithrix abyssi DSM 13497]
MAADSRSPRDGRFIETLGTYNPLEEPASVEIQEERIFYWLQNGAQPTQTVKNLLRRKGLWLKWDLMKHGAAPEKIEEEFKKWEALQVERQKRLEAKKAQASRQTEDKAEEKAAEEQTNSEAQEA